MTERLSIHTAEGLLDFTGGDPTGIIGPQVAEEQLAGAVAIHNLLCSQNIAYLADEVGMGKTYVALGAVALFRHFDPNFRVLVIAPRENIQDKWMREWRNFVRHDVTIEDMRIKAIGGEPARALVKAVSLVDFVSKASRDHDRDFFLRLTSFSLPTPEAMADESVKKQRNAMLAALPWLNHDLLSQKSKESYKRNCARAVNCALPQFDLVIVDEGHNLKAGWNPNQGSTRNLVLGYALGGKEKDAALRLGFRGYERKAQRVLFLSATPIEHDFRQLWNQLDLLGHGAGLTVLGDKGASDEEKRDVARGFLIRRVGKLRAGPTLLTKNQYRQEWRHGGASVHDNSMAIPDDRQKLTVALVQKKVSEVLGHAKNNHSFQVGLLASFESFAETVGLRDPLKDGTEEGEDPANQIFDNPDRDSRRGDANEGPDIDAVNAVSRDYQRKFGKSLPHPKMDALVNRLSEAFETGQKALVFVRRVASVDELQRKLEERYDEVIVARLRTELTDGVREELEAQIRQYGLVRAEERHKRKAVLGADDLHPKAAGTQESSNCDSFFSWFFRGEGPEDVLSGARLADRFDQVSGDYATFFEENYAAATLGCDPLDTLAALANATNLSIAHVRSELQTRVLEYLPAGSRTIRLNTFRAYQRAALDLLRSGSGQLQERAEAVINEVFLHERALGRRASKAPDPDEWLAVETLFTAFRLPEHNDLRAALWPSPTHGTVREQLRESELRRMLFATMARKGHPIIDLFVIVANRVGTLALRKRDLSAAGADDLSSQFLSLLQTQASGSAATYCSYSELANAAKHFNLIITQNAPEAREAPLGQVPTIFGRLLRSQRPVGGMAGTVSPVMVRQFRMPGYPLVLISTDLLQEGEDLQTFCSSVYHYGIAWMPSSLEQRVGRVDRVGSQTERRLTELQAGPTGEEKLQVYYPYLKDTVEVLQVNRVLHRLNRFLRLMHENLGMPELEKASIDVKEAMLQPPVEALPIEESLVSAFDVSPAMLKGRTASLKSDRTVAAARTQAFAELEGIAEGLDIAWLDGVRPNQRSGIRRMGTRQQPFTLLLRSLRGTPLVRCVSPVGEVQQDRMDPDLLHAAAHRPLVRVSLLLDERIKSYQVAVEGDMVFPDGARSLPRVAELVRAVTDAADAIEQAYQPHDPSYEEIMKDVPKEVEVER